MTVAALAPLLTTSVCGPHTLLSLAPLHSAAKEGVTTLSIDPSGDTQHTAAATPLTDTAVVLLNAGPAEKGGEGGVATSTRCAEPDSVSAQKGVDAAGGESATAASAASAEGDASTRLPLVHGDASAEEGASLALTPKRRSGSTETAELHDDLNTPALPGSSISTSYASARAAGRSTSGSVTEDEGGKRGYTRATPPAPGAVSCDVRVHDSCRVVGVALGGPLGRSTASARGRSRPPLHALLSTPWNDSAVALAAVNVNGIATGAESARETKLGGVTAHATERRSFGDGAPGSASRSSADEYGGGGCG